MTVPVRVLEAIERASLPILVYDLPRLRGSVRRLTDSFPAYYFPVKCNPHTDVLRTILEAGAGFSARSLGEVHQVISLGVRPGKLSYTGWGLGPAVMGRLIRVMAAVNLDSAREVRTWLHHFPGMPFGVRILAGTAPAYLNAGFTPGEIPTTLDAVGRAGGLLRTVQIHFPHESPTAADMVRDWSFLPSLLVSTLGASLEDLECLNLGGGWPGAYCEDEPMDPAEVSNLLRESLLQPLAAEGFAGRIAVEPGRFVAAPCGWWAARVIHVEDGPRTAVTIESPPPIPSERRNWPVLLLRGSCGKVSPVEEERVPCCLSGMSHLPFSVILEEVLLPRPRVGDVVLLGHAGAYMERALNHARGGVRVGEAVAED